MSRPVPEVDRLAGMLTYATDTGPVKGVIRAAKGDFVVEEIFDMVEIEPERKQGYVPVYSLTKTGVDTPHATSELAEAIKSNVNFAGMKDSNAVTTQIVSARSSRAQDPETVIGRGFEARRVGYLPRPVSRGMISGNRFRIVVRSQEDLAGPVERSFGACSSRKVPNFFGYQRFGLKSMVNQRVGASIIRRDFRDAILALGGSPRRDEDEESAEARSLFREERYREAASMFSPRRQDIERKVALYLADRPGDYLGAFRRVPMIPRRLLVQSYQSYLFNVTLSRALDAGEDISEPLAGDNWSRVSPDGLRATKIHGVKEEFSSETSDEGRRSSLVPMVQLVGYAFRDYGSRFDRIIVELLREEGVQAVSFYLKEADEVSVEGGFRCAPLLATEMSQASVEGGVALTFKLGRGEYATTLLREVLKPEDPGLAGF